MLLEVSSSTILYRSGGTGVTDKSRSFVILPRLLSDVHPDSNVQDFSCAPSPGLPSSGLLASMEYCFLRERVRCFEMDFEMDFFLLWILMSSII